jgi:hypothetical protein
VLCRAGARGCLGAAGGAGEQFRIAEQGLQTLGQGLGGQRRLRHDPAAAGLRQAAGVGGLVVVRGGGIGDHQRRTAGGRQFRDGRGAGPADHQMRGRQARRHVVEERRQVMAHAAALVDRRDLVQRRAAHLLADLQARPQIFREAADRVRNHLVEDACALAAADHQQAKPALAARHRIGPSAQGGDGRAHRVAGDMQLVPVGLRETRDPVERDGDRPRARRHQPIGTAEHGVLLVQDHAQAAARGGHDRGYRGVATEADHDIGPHFLEQAARLKVAHAQADHALQPFDGAGPGHAGGADVMSLDLGQFRAESAAAPVGDQGHAQAPGNQFPGQRLGREHVAARAAGRQDHALGSGAGHAGSPVPTRRRVKPSSMPMPSAMDSSDDPP